MENFGEEGSPQRNRPLQIQTVTGDVRKFSDYVLSPENAIGKDKIFLDRLGFRERNLEDAQILLDTYLTQAEAKLSEGQYQIGRVDQFGQRFTIEINVRGLTLLTGWILTDGSILRLTTPFAGFPTSTNGPEP
jgi:hypothetical protein